MTTQTLLVELLTEELPPKALKTLGAAFAEGVSKGLASRDFLESEAKQVSFASPRRLAVAISHVRSESLERKVVTKLMPISVALDASGKPTPALKKKLQSLGVQDDASFDSNFSLRVSRKQDGKNEVLTYTDLATGSKLVVGLMSAVEESIEKLPIPKVMSYQRTDALTGMEKTEKFVRPVHGLLAMHGSDVITIGALGLVASNTTQGHRFQGEKNITLAHADEYEAKLESAGNVIASFDKRRAEIERQLRQQAAQQNARLETGEIYEELLDEVAALVEYPTVYVGTFEQEFLLVPPECLTLTMRANQKYFP